MKIGFIVDGSAESQALKVIIEKIKINNVSFVNPIYADMQPRATPARIYSAAKDKLQILRVRNVDKIVVMIDYDDRDECIITYANSVKNAFAEKGYDNIEVVIKNRSFENWLIADVEALKGMRSRFNVTMRFTNQIVPNKADNINKPVQLINAIIKGKKYHKGSDSIQIAKCLDPFQVSANSRSFRKFLRVINHQKYQEQSKVPVLCE